MASLRSVAVRIANLINTFNHNGFRSMIVSRPYSIYPPDYHRPVFRPVEQKELLESDEGKEFAHYRIRPALTTDTCSEFYDPLINKFVNYIMRGGKKEIARCQMDSTLRSIKMIQIGKCNKLDDDLKDSVEVDARKIVHLAVNNAAPVLQLIRVMKGGIGYQVPIPVTEKRGIFLGIKWMITEAKIKQRHVRFYDSLARVLIATAENKGPVVKKKQDLHKACDANRAYAHYRWQRR